jgi:hypothetical protein
MSEEINWFVFNEKREAKIKSILRIRNSKKEGEL